MDDPGEGTSKVPLIEEEPIPFADSPQTPANPLRDGIILLITSEGGEGGGAGADHPLSEYYLLPVAPDALRRLSLQPPEGANAHPERKVSCPDETLARDIDRLTPTSFSSRRSSTASSRRSSNCSQGHHRRSSNCSRRSSNCSSRRSSSASRRSSNCSRRSSEDEHLHHHHHQHRSSSVHQHRRSSHRPHSPGGSLSREDIEREELEMGGIPPRHRRIIILVIGSVSVFILVMSVVLIAVSLTLSPTIDDLVRKGNEEIYRSMSAGASTPAPSTEGTTNHTTPPSG